jgi:hypothetical protein
LETEPRTTFYLASDDEQVRRKFKDVFGTKVIMADPELSRASQRGIQDALVELYTLAATSRIFGSYRSTFSRVASDLSGVDLIWVESSDA